MTSVQNLAENLLNHSRLRAVHDHRPEIRAVSVLPLTGLVDLALRTTRIDPVTGIAMNDENGNERNGWACSRTDGRHFFGL